MDATCTIQDSIHVFSLIHKYVSRILGTYHCPMQAFFYVTDRSVNALKLDKISVKSILPVRKGSESVLNKLGLIQP